MVGVGSYALSAILLAILGLSVGFAAFRIRRHLLSAWEGAPARLVEIVLAVALLIWLCELLGLFGLLYASTLVIESLLLAAAIAIWPIGASPAGGGGEGGIRMGESANPSFPPDRTRGQDALTLTAIAVIALVFAHWGLFAKYALDHGMSNFDSLSSYMPSATSMAQSHSVVGVHHVGTDSTSWLLPQNAELLHAAGILLTHRDTLSLFINFGWLAFAFLAAWCVGRPYGRGPLSVVGAAIVLESGTLIVRNPGTAKDDVMAAALLLAAIAILLNARSLDVSRRGAQQLALPGWPLAAAGLAVGLAVGTKATVLAMVAALSLAVIVAAPRGRRVAATGWWFLPALAGGGFWYLRNLILAGNPIPQVSGLGPVPLPHPDQLQGELPAFSILHYATDTAVWRDYFGPGLEVALGSLWPLVIGGGILGALLVLLQDRDRALRWIGGIALFGVLAYLATPLTAAGPDGAPVQFYINVRYAAPALLVGLVVLPLAPGLNGPFRRWALLAALLVVLWITDGADAVLHDPDRGFGLLLAAVAVGIPALILLMRRWGASDRELAGGFAVLALLLVAIGYPLQRNYLHDRFGPGSGLPGQEMNSAYLWARGVSDARIGIVGTTAGFYQYGLYGTDLSNEVIYIGEEGPHAAFNPIPDCRGFREAVDDAHLDYLVTSPFLNFLDAADPVASPEAGWLRGVPAVRQIESAGDVTVWRVGGALGATPCGPGNVPLHAVPQQPNV
jgi:hypothetical protein